MKLLTADQIRTLDRLTIAREPISSTDLMERAANAFVRWFVNEFPETDRPILIFCGSGNNGGDGLAVARLLLKKGYQPRVILCKITDGLSADSAVNLERLKYAEGSRISVLQEGAEFPILPAEGILVDAILGSGLSRPVEGYWAQLLKILNESDGTRIAIDIPTGLFADRPTHSVSFHADLTLTFELPKRSFLHSDNSHRVGRLVTVSIGLDQFAWEGMPSSEWLVEHHEAARMVRKRDSFAHKGNFGHALLVCGSRGKMGAAILAGRAALRSGAGLVTIHTPGSERLPIQANLPEAMVSCDSHEGCFSSLPESTLSNWSAIGIGCGMGVDPASAKGLTALLEHMTKPMILDADALNILSAHPDLLSKLPPNSILTPHPGEYKRLFHPTVTDGFEMWEDLRERSSRLGVFIILKGAYTAVAMPDGRLSINPTGNPGMATAGSGDVLTGILTGLLAQGYDPKDTAVLGVYLHGLAGDVAVRHHQSEQSLIAGDLADHLGEAYKLLKT